MSAGRFSSLSPTTIGSTSKLLMLLFISIVSFHRDPMKIFVMSVGPPKIASFPSVRPVPAAQPTDPHGPTVEIGKAAPQNDLAKAAAGTAVNQTLVICREDDEQGEWRPVVTIDQEAEAVGSAWRSASVETNKRGHESTIEVVVSRRTDPPSTLRTGVVIMMLNVSSD